MGLDPLRLAGAAASAQAVADAVVHAAERNPEAMEMAAAFLVSGQLGSAQASHVPTGGCGGDGLSGSLMDSWALTVGCAGCAGAG